MKVFHLYRRNFIKSSLLLPFGSSLLFPFSQAFGQRSRNQTVKKGTVPWKWDTILWDEDRHRAGSVGREFFRLKDGSLALRLEVHDEQGYNSDVYSASIRSFGIRSSDGGLTWGKYEGPLLEENQTRLSDGTLFKVYAGGAVSLEERRALLARVGGNPDTASREGNDLWPENKREELEQKGYQVDRGFPGTVGTLMALSVSKSSDNGKTYEYKMIEGLPRLANIFASFRRVIELRDGTLLAAGFAKRERGAPHFSFVIRSTDKGKSWSFHPVAEDQTRRLDFNETEIIQLPNGKVLAMMRTADTRSNGVRESSAGVGTTLHQSSSADGGLSWTPYERTSIWGAPPQLIVLKSGKLLCTYAHRRHPYGVRACLSNDLGKTWDYENEKIIRDDSLPGLVDYPTSTQIADGTILTAYTISKIPRIPYRPDDQVVPNKDLLVHLRKRQGQNASWYGGYHAIAGLSRYTEDYVRATGQVTSRTMWPGDTFHDDNTIERK